MLFYNIETKEYKVLYNLLNLTSFKRPDDERNNGCIVVAKDDRIHSLELDEYTFTSLHTLSTREGNITLVSKEMTPDNIHEVDVVVLNHLFLSEEDLDKLPVGIGGIFLISKTDKEYVTLVPMTSENTDSNLLYHLQSFQEWMLKRNSIAFKDSIKNDQVVITSYEEDLEDYELEDFIKFIEFEFYSKDFLSSFKDLE